MENNIINISNEQYKKLSDKDKIEICRNYINEGKIKTLLIKIPASIIMLMKNSKLQSYLGEISEIINQLDHEQILNLIKEHAAVITLLSPEKKTDNLILEYIKVNPFCYIKLDEQLKNETNTIEAIRQNGLLIEYIPDSLIKKVLNEVKTILINNPTLLLQLKIDLNLIFNQNQNEIFEFLKDVIVMNKNLEGKDDTKIKCLQTIKVPDNIRKELIALIHQNKHQRGNSLDTISIINAIYAEPKHIQNFKDEMLKTTLSQIFNLNLPKYKIKQFIDTLIVYNFNIIKEVSKNLSEENQNTLWEIVCEINPELFRFMPDNLKTRELSFKAVKYYGALLKYVPLQYRDSEICMEAVKQDGRNLQYVPENIQKRNIDIVTTAVKENKSAIQYVKDISYTNYLHIKSLYEDKERYLIPEEIRDIPFEIDEQTDTYNYSIIVPYIKHFNVLLNKFKQYCKAKNQNTNKLNSIRNNLLVTPKLNLILQLLNIDINTLLNHISYKALKNKINQLFKGNIEPINLDALKKYKENNDIEALNQLITHPQIIILADMLNTTPKEFLEKNDYDTIVANINKYIFNNMYLFDVEENLFPFPEQRFMKDLTRNDVYDIITSIKTDPTFIKRYTASMPSNKKDNEKVILLYWPKDLFNNLINEDFFKKLINLDLKFRHYLKQINDEFTIVPIAQAVIYCPPNQLDSWYINQIQSDVFSFFKDMQKKLQQISQNKSKTSKPLSLQDSIEIARQLGGNRELYVKYQKYFDVVQNYLSYGGPWALNDLPSLEDIAKKYVDKETQEVTPEQLDDFVNAVNNKIINHMKMLGELSRLNFLGRANITSTQNLTLDEINDIYNNLQWLIDNWYEMILHAVWLRAKAEGIRHIYLNTSSTIATGLPPAAKEVLYEQKPKEFGFERKPSNIRKKIKEKGNAEDEFEEFWHRETQKILKLIKLANDLDKKHLYKQSDIIDKKLFSSIY